MIVYLLTGWVLAVGHGDQQFPALLPEFYKTREECLKRVDWISNNTKYVAEAHLTCDPIEAPIPES